MTTMIRKAQLWAGLSLITMLLAGCPSPEPSECEQNPASCMDSGVCTPTIEGPAEGNCDDNVDNDCDGDRDAADSDCDGTCTTSGPEDLNTGNSCTNGVDDDCDGDMDDDDSACNSACVPSGVEGPENVGSCTDGADNDCDGMQDNVDPMDPKCEPMSCTPGSTSGADTRETLHRSNVCWDETWKGPYLNILQAPQAWSCCPLGGGPCASATISYQGPTTPGYESVVSVASTSELVSVYVFEANEHLVSYKTSGNWNLAHMELDSSITFEVRTGSASASTLVRTWTCTR